jgi:hypothetical protein
MRLKNPDSLARNATLIRVWRALGEPPCHLAGGFLRDHLLGRSSNDLDLSLPGTADEAAAPARRLARALGTRAHLLGQAPRCVWRIETEDLKVELWPLGALSLEEDILRRDFSCNALMWQLPSGPLVDRVEGLGDLRHGRLRAISADNLDRDPVRLLRGPRFLATHPSFELDGQTSGWIRRLAPRLAESPRERIGQELALLLRGERPSRGLAATEYAWPRDCRRTAARAADLIDDAGTVAVGPPADRREMIHAAASAFPTLVALGAALVHSSHRNLDDWRRWWRQWRRSGADFTTPRQLLTADEIGALAGVEAGPELGRAIHELQHAQVRGEIRSPAGARRWLRARYLQPVS